MKLSVSHDTRYSYDDQVRASIQYLRLTPQPSTRQRVLDWALELPGTARAQRDGFGNLLHVLTLDEPHEAVVIHARGVVEIDAACECEPDPQSPFPYLRSTRLTEADDALRTFAAHHGGRDRDGLIALMHALHAQMAYVPGMTDVESTAAQAFAGAQGVCQDHAHVFIACARSLGVPARYVSGYLYTEHSVEVASHAWAEAWLDGAWYCFDVTNRMARPERHLKLAVGLDYLDACPVRGMRRGGGEQMHAHLQIPAEEGALQAQVRQQ